MPWVHSSSFKRSSRRDQSFPIMVLQNERFSFLMTFCARLNFNPKYKLCVSLLLTCCTLTPLNVTSRPLIHTPIAHTIVLSSNCSSFHQIAEKLGISEEAMKDVNTTMREAWKLWDVSFQTSLTEEAAPYLRHWLDAGVAQIEEAQGAKYVEGYNRRSFFAYGRAGYDFIVPDYLPSVDPKRLRSSQPCTRFIP